MKDIEELRGLSSNTSSEISVESLDRVYNEILFPQFKSYAKKFKRNKIRLTDNLSCPKARELMKLLFKDKFTVQTLVETEMKPYLEKKGYKVTLWSPSYSVEVSW